jgi:hypothetical protein
MRKSLLALVLCAPTVALACKKDEQPPAQQPMYAPQAPGAQPAPAQPAPAQPAPAQPAPAAPAAAAPAGPLSQPGPLAGPCTSDANCFTHRCNTQVGKCVLPCVTNNDCNAGNNCMAGVCVPALPQQQ